jgi:hypothetical protein
MAITKSIENNKTLLKVGLQFEFNDCRNRVAVHLQKNLDRIREEAVFCLFAFFSGENLTEDNSPCPTPFHNLLRSHEGHFCA